MNLISLSCNDLLRPDQTNPALCKQAQRFYHEMMINVKPEWYKDNNSFHLAASPEMRAVSSTERSSRSHPATFESEWRGTTARRTPSIFHSSVGNSASVLSLSCTYIPQVSTVRGMAKKKKEPATPPSLLTSSYYLALFLFVFATLSFII